MHRRSCRGVAIISEKRREAILRELRLRGTLEVTEFAARLGVSPITLRRDLRTLEAAGQLTRVHGGARHLRRPAAESPGGAQRQLAATFGLAQRGGDDLPVATIGMIAPTSTYYYAEAIEGAREAARLAGVRLVLAISGYDQDEEVRIFQRMIDIEVDGILVTPSKSSLDDSRIRSAIESSPVPTTVVERQWEYPTTGRVIDSVRSDHAHGARIALDHLADLGHTRVAVWSFQNPHETEIRDSFRAAAEARGCTVVRPEFDYGHPDWDDTRIVRNVRRYLAATREAGATALLLHPDQIALQLVQEALAVGLRIPDDLSLIAYDDEVAGLSEMALTAVEPPKRAIGFAAIDACLRAIAHRSSGPHRFPAQRLRLLPTLHVRSSTAPPADGEEGSPAPAGQTCRHSPAAHRGNDSIDDLRPT